VEVKALVDLEERADAKDLDIVHIKVHQELREEEKAKEGHQEVASNVEDLTINKIARS
jgi:hypothetical protein